MATIRRIGGVFEVSYRGKLVGACLTPELALELVAAVGPNRVAYDAWVAPVGAPLGSWQEGLWS